MDEKQNKVPNEVVQPEEEIFKQRKEKLLRLREEEGYDPYRIEKWERTDMLDRIRKEFDHLAPDETDASVHLRSAGRVMTLRKHGKAMFAHLQDETDTLQLYFQFDKMGEAEYGFVKKWVDTGDWIGVEGHPFRTQRGELTILVTKCTLLSKALRPMPEKWHGLTDTEVRYRQRYLDLIVHPDVRDVFRKRSAIISSVRKTLEDAGTLEVETPILFKATPEGARLYRHFLQIELLEADLREDLQPLAEVDPVGPRSIPIAVNADSLATWVVPALSDFHARTGDTVALQTASGIPGLSGTVKFHWNGRGVEIVGNTTR